MTARQSLRRNCLISTGSRAARPPIPGAEGPGRPLVWTLARRGPVIADVQAGTKDVRHGGPGSSLAPSDAILSLGAALTIVEVAPRIPAAHGGRGLRDIVAPGGKTDASPSRGATLTKIEEWKGKRKAHLQKGRAHLRFADLYHGHGQSATNLECSTVRHRGFAEPAAQSSRPTITFPKRERTVYAAGDVALAPTFSPGRSSPRHRSPAGARNAWSRAPAAVDLAYRAACIMNLVEVCHLDDLTSPPSAMGRRQATSSRPAGRSLASGSASPRRQLTAPYLRSREDIWTTNDVGMLKGSSTRRDSLAWKNAP